MTTPFLSAPFGTPFGPSAHLRCGSAYLFPRLSALGCLTSFACVELTLPSADFCWPLSADRSALSPCSPGPPADLPGYDTERSARRRRIDQVHPRRMEDFAVTCPLLPGAPHLISGSCSSPRACGLGFLQTPPHGGRPCPSPSLRLREYLARGLAPRSFCAMPGTHVCHQARASSHVACMALLDHNLAMVRFRAGE